MEGYRQALLHLLFGAVSTCGAVSPLPVVTVDIPEGWQPIQVDPGEELICWQLMGPAKEGRVPVVTCATERTTLSLEEYLRAEAARIAKDPTTTWHRVTQVASPAGPVELCTLEQEEAFDSVQMAQAFACPGDYAVVLTAVLPGEKQAEHLALLRDMVSQLRYWRSPESLLGKERWVRWQDADAIALEPLPVEESTSLTVSAWLMGQMQAVRLLAAQRQSEAVPAQQTAWDPTSLILDGEDMEEL